MTQRPSPFWLWSRRQADRLDRLQGMLRGRRVVTLHHLACAGGTLFTKCLAAMPDAMMLSEIHPDRTAQPDFHPLIQVRRGYGDVLDRRHLSPMDSHFLREIGLAHDIAVSLGRRLIVRDHAHADFAFQYAGKSRLHDVLSRSFRVTPIVTVRDPVEVYLSLQSNNWFDGSLNDFCKVQSALLDAFPDAPVLRYEDLVSDPENIVRTLCEQIGITYVPGFQERLVNVRHLTGDSGRRGTVITPRPPKPVPDDIGAEIEASTAYGALCERLGYPPRRSRSGNPGHR